MPSSVRVDGVDQLKVLARDLRRAGRTDLKIEFKKEINRFARDNSIKEKIHDSAMEMLPSGGGHKRRERRDSPGGSGEGAGPERGRQLSSGGGSGAAIGQGSGGLTRSPAGAGTR